MSPDVRTLLGEAAARPRRPLDSAELLDRSRAIGRRRALVAVAVLPVLAVAATVALRPPSEPGVVTAPRPGEVTYAKLPDGTRVYVVAHADGSVSVLDTLVTHRSTAVDQQVGWCASSRWFEDPRHGSRYDEHGVYVFGPAPADLAYYRVTHHGGNRYRIGEKVVPTGRGTSHVPAAGPVCNDGADAPALAFWDAPDGGGHDRTYQSVTGVPDRRYSRVEALLLVDENGATEVCDRFASDCLPFRSNERGMPRDAQRRYEGTYVVRRDGGEIAEIVRTGWPERSSSRQKVYRFQYVDTDGLVNVRQGELLTGDFADAVAREARVAVPHGLLVHLPAAGRGFGTTVHPDDRFRIPGRVVGGAEWVAYLRARPGTLFTTDAEPVRDLRHLEVLDVDPRLVTLVDAPVHYDPSYVDPPPPGSS